MEIKELKIYSSKIKEHADFYSKVLVLIVIKLTEDNVFLEIGKSILNIEFKAEKNPYHFAINIPSNKEYKALEWLKSRMEIFKEEGNERIKRMHEINYKTLQLGMTHDNSLIF